MNDKSEGICLMFILHWGIYLVKRGEPEGTLGGHIESLAKR